MRFSDLTLAIMPIFGLAGNVMIQIVLYRYRIVRSLLRGIFWGFGLGGTAVLLGSFGSNNFGHIALNLTTYALLGYGYFHFINLGETARRIRILREILEAGKINENELISRYPSDEMIILRLERLLRNGQIRVVQGKISINKRAVFCMAIFLGRLKSLLKIDKVLVLREKNIYE